MTCSTWCRDPETHPGILEVAILGHVLAENGILKVAILGHILAENDILVEPSKFG